MTPAPKPPPVRLCFIYSRADQPLHDKLQTHLSSMIRAGTLEVWADRRFEGSQMSTAERGSLESAEILLLLVSPDFVASDDIWNEQLDHALRRQEAGTAKVIPILLRPTNIEELAFFRLKALPDIWDPHRLDKNRSILPGENAVTTWNDLDEALTHVAKAIGSVAAALQKDPVRNAAPRPERKPAPAPTPAPASPSPSAAPALAPSPAAAAPGPYAPGLRNLIDAFLWGDDFDGFCLVHFPKIKKRFTAGMQQPQKLNILIEHADHTLLVQKLREEYPDEVARREHLLRPK